MPDTNPSSMKTAHRPAKSPSKRKQVEQTSSKKFTGQRLTRAELSRHEREARLNRMIMAGMGAVALLVVIVLGVGWYREFVARQWVPVAMVAGRSISIEDYSRRLDFQQKSTEQQIQYYQSQLQGNSGNESLANLFRQQIQQMQLNMFLLPDQVLDSMIDEEVIRQESARRSIVVGADEVDAEITKTFGDPPTPVPTSVPAPVVEPGAAPPPSPTPAPTLAPVPTADVQSRLATFLGLYELRTADYRGMVEAQLLRQKLQKAIGDESPTAGEQVHARHILVDAEEKAREIYDKLKAGGSFEELAKAESKDTSNKDKGGDLGWFSRGRMVAEFDAVVFELPPNQISAPVKTSFGWHLVEVLEKDSNHPFDEATLSGQKSQVFNDWLTKARTAPDVNRELSEAQRNWVYQRIKWSPTIPGR